MDPLKKNDAHAKIEDLLEGTNDALNITHNSSAESQASFKITSGI
jgi:hypothetical protein